MSKTTEVIALLDHTSDVLYKYIQNIENAGFTNPDHSAAKRATLDLSRKLAEWRQEPAQYQRVK